MITLGLKSEYSVMTDEHKQILEIATIEILNAGYSLEAYKPPTIAFKCDNEIAVFMQLVSSNANPDVIEYAIDDPLVEEDKEL